MKIILRKTLLISVLMSASAGVNAESFSASFDFDNVASGSTANSALGSYGSIMHFVNPDTAEDVDANGSLTGTFHWVDATSTYGDVRVSADPNAISPSNVLTNDRQPIILSFNTPQSISAFSIQQDSSGFGNLQTDGTYLAFLDSTGHEINGARFFYTQGGSPGLFIQTAGLFNDVSGVLLAGGVNYDNLNISAVPLPAALPLLLSGVLGAGWFGRARRRR